MNSSRVINMMWFSRWYEACNPTQFVGNQAWTSRISWCSRERLEAALTCYLSHGKGRGGGGVQHSGAGIINVGNRIGFQSYRILLASLVISSACVVIAEDQTKESIIKTHDRGRWSTSTVRQQNISPNVYIVNTPF